jgi:hypothetical protein
MTRGIGLLVSFPEKDEAELIVESEIGGYQPFSEVYNSANWGSGQVRVALLSFGSNTFDYIAIARRGNRVVTNKYRVDYSSIVNLQEISIDEIQLGLEKSLQNHFIRARDSDGLVPKATWSSVVQLLKKIRPNQATEIDRLLSLAKFSGFHFSSQYAEILALEREAIGISLDIFSGNNKLRETVLSEWAPNESSVTQINEERLEALLQPESSTHLSFLSGISTYHQSEESALQHDLMNWPEMTATHNIGYSIFQQGERRLELIYANRNALEATLGVDLIYFNKSYEQFVLVQYKAMREEGDVARYRPDAQLTKQLDQMNTFNQSQKRSTEIESDSQYRLNSDGFFFKLVPKATLRPATGELIKGMYLPLEYMNFLVGPRGPKGSNGGSNITFRNAPRYLTNSQFSSSVNSGWFGTRGTQTEVVKSLIKQFYETGSAVVLAIENLNPSPKNAKG